MSASSEKNDTLKKDDAIKTNDKEPSDDEIIGFNVKKLKEYIKKNDSVHVAIACDKEKSTGIDKDELRFMALDSKPCGWTKERLINLRPQCRQYLINKIRNVGKIEETSLQLFTNCNEENSKEIETTIDELFAVLKSIKEQESIQRELKKKTKTNKTPKADTKQKNNDENKEDDDDDEKKQREMQRDDATNNDEFSSVSTHSSMPSLMSDDESDDDFDDDLDDDSYSDASEQNEIPTKDQNKKENIPPSNQKEQIKKTQKNKPKKDDFMSNPGNFAGMFNKQPPKKKKKTKKMQTKLVKMKSEKRKDVKAKVIETKLSKRETLHKMGYKLDVIDKVELSLPNNATIDEIASAINALSLDENEGKKEERFGYHLLPKLDVNRDANGQMFVCVGERKIKAKLREYQYLKCTVSFSQKLKKKAKNVQYLYDAILIDLRCMEEQQMRGLERQKLKNCFENVLSFDLESKHRIIDVQPNVNQRELSLKEAFEEYAQRHQLKKREKQISKLVTAGFEDEEARKAMEMSLEKQSVKSVFNDDDIGNAEELKSNIAENTQQIEQNDDIVRNAEEVEKISKHIEQMKRLRAEEDKALKEVEIAEKELEIAKKKLKVAEQNESLVAEVAVVSEPISNSQNVENKNKIPAVENAKKNEDQSKEIGPISHTQRISKDDVIRAVAENVESEIGNKPFAVLLKSWGLERHIMKMYDEGWDDPSYWKDLSDQELRQDIGFRGGCLKKWHRNLNQYIAQQNAQNGSSQSNANTPSISMVSSPASSMMSASSKQSKLSNHDSFHLSNGSDMKSETEGTINGTPGPMHKYWYITPDLMNECRLKRDDLKQILQLISDDGEANAMCKEVYVRLKWNSEYRVGRIEKWGVYSSSYKFMKQQTTKCLQVSQAREGLGIKQQKLNKISDSDLTQKEIDDWLQRMEKANAQIPSFEDLKDIKDTVVTVRTVLKTRKEDALMQSLQTTQSPKEPGLPSSPPQNTTPSPPKSPPDQRQNILSSAISQNSFNGHALTHQHLHIHTERLQKIHPDSYKSTFYRYLTHYLTAIEQGYNCFYIIPTPKGDSQYIAFLLKNKDSSKPLLKQAKKTVKGIARKHGMKEVESAVIREYAIEPDQSKHKQCGLKDGCWLLKGFLADCKTKKVALEILHQLQADIRGKFGKSNPKSSFCRLVLAEFGEAFIRVQKDPNKPRPENKDKPQGPMYPYTDDDDSSSIEGLVKKYGENMSVGEYDHSVASSSRAPSVGAPSSIAPTESSKASTHSTISMVKSVYSQPGLSRKARKSEKKKKEKKKKNKSKLEVGDEVNYCGERYQITAVLDDMMSIQNDISHKYIKKADYDKITKC